MVYIQHVVLTMRYTMCCSDLSPGDPRQRENVSISPRRVARSLSMDAGKADTPIDNAAVSTVPASRVADKNALNSNEEDDNNSEGWSTESVGDNTEEGTVIDEADNGVESDWPGDDSDGEYETNLL
ncbi:hypothetical protein L917_18023 [Phytophthora nicotianae]|uniref:Uncharacterized protein n=1 Tax=Phytophthora nicotianae TaxID=4792 RepID=W2KAY6_PHYNI|nr:hypothetical protein L917_18023 [Phytophthora nicotianae]